MWLLPLPPPPLLDMALGSVVDLFDDVDDAVMMKALATSVGSLPALAPWSVGHLHGKRQEEIV